MNTQTTRVPWIAAVLSLFCTGLGHIYCGRIVTGLSLFLVSLMFAPIVLIAAAVPASTAVLLGLLLATTIVLLVCLFAVIDSYRLARRVRNGFELREYNRPVVYIVFLFLGLSATVGVSSYLRDNAIEAYRIPTSSMKPNVLHGDRLLVNKMTYDKQRPARGDVVVFRPPNDRGVRYIKRLIALPDDRVEVRNNRVHINGRELHIELVEEGLYRERSDGLTYLIRLGEGPGVADFEEAVVPAGMCFVLGDNRDGSRDSRHFSFVALGDVIGRAEYVYWPAQSWSRFGPIGEHTLIARPRR